MRIEDNDDDDNTMINGKDLIVKTDIDKKARNNDKVRRLSVLFNNVSFTIIGLIFVRLHL